MARAANGQSSFIEPDRRKLTELQARRLGSNGYSRAYSPAGSNTGRLSEWNYGVVFSCTPTALDIAVISVERARGE